MSGLLPAPDDFGTVRDGRELTPSRHSTGPSTNGGNRPETVIHWNHAQGPLPDQKAAVRTALLKPPVLTHISHSGSPASGALAEGRCPVLPAKAEENSGIATGLLTRSGHQ